MGLKKLIIFLSGVCLASVTVFSSACSGGSKENGNLYTYRTFTSVSPSNWNELTISDNNDRQIANYIRGSLFEFDFAYNEDGEIIDGGFSVNYSAATKLEDVTAELVGSYGIAEGTTSNRAWKITLRNDLKWDDGSPIKAEDFVYSMAQTLDPKFMNRLAANYYSANMVLHNAREYVYSEDGLAFDEVGIFAPSEYELVIVFDNTFEFLDENGDLTYQAAYYMNDLPLVKRDLFESCKKEPSIGSTLYTSNYGSSVSTSASWGAYKLSQYQSGTSYTLVRNENWYGYNMDEYEGQYQTDAIVCRTIPEWNTAWMAFRSGDLDGINIDATISAQYRTSKQAYFTPSDLVASVHIQSSKEALEKRESAGINKTILMQPEFRQALSLAIDRNAYAQAATTSSLAGLGYFNSMHYYDVASGGVYRDTEVAKIALLRAYGAEDLGGGRWKVGANEYDNVDEAESALTGYNLALAKELVKTAYERELSEGNIKSTDRVLLTFGSSQDNASARRHYNFLKDSWTELMKGTPLEGRFETAFEGTHGDEWAKNFKNGQYDIAPASGFSGGAWNPYYMIGAEVNTKESIRYNHGWDTTKQYFEFTMADANGVSKKYNLSVQDWYDSLNGLQGGSYNFSLYPTESRLALVAELEYVALKSYWDIPTFYSYQADLHSYKTEFVTYEYNTFMEYGGIRYMKYNYNDGEWARYVSSQGGSLNYAN